MPGFYCCKFGNRKNLVNGIGGNMTFGMKIAMLVTAFGNSAPLGIQLLAGFLFVITVWLLTNLFARIVAWLWDQYTWWKIAQRRRKFDREWMLIFWSLGIPWYGLPRQIFIYRNRKDPTVFKVNINTHTPYW